MPTIRVIGDNEVQFIDASGDVLARMAYDEVESKLTFLDDQGGTVPLSHADTHAAGGGDEIDVTALSGDAGQPGQVLTSDGTGVSFSDIPADPVSRTLSADNNLNTGEVSVTTTDTEIVGGDTIRLVSSVPYTANTFESAVLGGETGSFALGQTTAISFSDPGGVLTRADGGNIFEYTLSTGYDLSTITDTGKSTATPEGVNAQGLTWADGGAYLFAVDNNGIVGGNEYTTPYDIASASGTTFFEELGLFGVRDIEFASDGSKMFILDEFSSVFEYPLSTPYDPTTRQPPEAEAVGGPQNAISFAFSPDGTVLVIANGSGDIVGYTLSTAYDITTASSGTPGSIPLGLVGDFEYSADGLRWFVEDGGTLRQYDAADDATVGDALIEFSALPEDDVADWERATYLVEPDGETVEVYLEVDNGTGFTATNGGNPIPRGYDLSADGDVNPDSNLRFRVDLQRNNTDNNPRFDAGYLRYLV